MVEISVSGDHVHLEVKGLDKLWAFKGHLDIPITNVRGVRADPEVEVADPAAAINQVSRALRAP